MALSSNNILYHSSGIQEWLCCAGLAEGQDVGGGAVTWKLPWGCRICFLDGARTWPSAGGLRSSPRGLLLRLLGCPHNTTASSLRARDPRDGERKQGRRLRVLDDLGSEGTRHHSCITLLIRSSSLSSACIRGKGSWPPFFRRGGESRNFWTYFEIAAFSSTKLSLLGYTGPLTNPGHTKIISKFSCFSRI